MNWVIGGGLIDRGGKVIITREYLILFDIC
jgi:hypothetical protein